MDQTQEATGLSLKNQDNSLSIKYDASNTCHGHMIVIKSLKW